MTKFLWLYRVSSWSWRLHMNHNWPRNAIRGDWIGMGGVHWSSFLKILGKMKVDWKHVGTTAWNGKMLSLSVKPCARWWEHFCRTRRETAAKPGTLGGIISSMPFHVLRIIVVEVILDFNGVESINVFDIGKKVSLGCTNGWESTS